MQITIPVNFTAASIAGASAPAVAVAQLFTDAARTSIAPGGQASAPFPADPSSGVVNVTLNAEPGPYFRRRYLADSEANIIGGTPVDDEYTVPLPNTYVAV